MIPDVLLLFLGTVWKLLCWIIKAGEKPKFISDLKNKESFMHDTMQLHDLVWFLVIGGFAGWIASVLVKGSGLGLIGDVVVGVLGAFLGGFFAYQFDIAMYGFWRVFGMSIVGAVVLLVLLRAVVRPRRLVS